MKISVCILTKNSSATLQKTLESVRAFPEVLLLDNGSTDDTLAIAQNFENVSIHHSPFIGFGPLRNLAAKNAKNDWILALDSDEIVSEELAKNLHSLPLQRGQIYSLNRHNFYRGKRIKGCGWDRDRPFRLYHREDTAYNDAPVHEALLPNELKKIALEAPVFHTPYRSTSDFLKKMEHYSSLFAEQHQGKQSSFGKAFRHGLFAFLRSYFLQRGLFLGKEGFIISLYNANSTFYKYLKLYENTKIY